ncbi:MAG TPA: hypothetical protein ENH62_08425 [Marinobacter sp.]|uniref:Uncharacterized protein n=1 Tax=marine sediment metagenome TaxID=412755 RepID=A0A0F9R2M5_9ZZZZ|nr:hypothetical protein [Marinobacter sp.]
MSQGRNTALLYTVSMVVGLAVGAYFSPIFSIFGGFAGLYVIAVLKGKIKPGRSVTRVTGNKSLDNHLHIQDIIDGDGRPGSGRGF